MTSIYMNTKMDRKVQRLIKQTEAVIQRFLFFIDWGYMCGCQNHKDMTS